MFARHSHHLAAASLLCFLSLLAAPAGAQITVGGDPGEVSPADPSTWVTTTSAEVGIDSGSTGTITVTGASSVSSNVSYLGYNPGSSGVATITDAGSAWRTSTSLYVGYAGTGALRVENGGRASSNASYLGYSFDSSGTATVTDSGSKWTNTNFYVGDYSEGVLSVANGGAVSTSSYGYLGYDSGSSGIVTIADLGSIWSTGVSLYIGRSGAGSLSVDNGGKVSSGAYGYIGYNNGSIGSATITGPGSTWANNNSIYVGHSGSGTLNVEDGGKVGSGFITNYLGYNASGNGTALITGPSSTLTGGLLYVGNSGTGSLTVANGGTVTASGDGINSYGNCYVGNNPGSSGTVTVAGQGSVLNSTATWWASGGIPGWLYVGNSGTGTLNVNDGGQVSYYSGFVGYNAGSSGKTVITGIGSTWNNRYELDVGYFGTGEMRIENGGTASNSVSYIGYNAGSSGTVTVTGSGSTWTVSRPSPSTPSMIVGSSGTGMLTVGNGGTVNIPSGWCSVGSGSGSSGTAIVTGQGSTLTTSTIYVGESGTGTLRVENGGTVVTSAGRIASATGSSGTVAITGPGSAWNCGSLFVKGNSYGTGGVAAIAVENGGTINVGTLYDSTLSELGGDSTINARGLVSDMDVVFGATAGAGKTFSFGTGGTLNLSFDGTGSLGVGYLGTGSLRISDGVKISSSAGYLGYYVGSRGTALVTGTGSTWNSTNLFVCYGGSYLGTGGTGTLRVENGGTVTNSTAYIGEGSSVNGTVTVTGAGSTWTSSNLLYVGTDDVGYGTGTLTVGSGGKVAAKKVSVIRGAVNLHVSGDGMLVLGDSTTAGSVSGKINLYADAFLTANTYVPITECQGRAMTLGGYNGYGGTWDKTAKTFTVAAAATSGSGASNALTTGERLLITDSATGKRVGASFGTVAGGTNFSAAVLSGSALSGLPADQSVLGAWNFSTNFSGDQALLSFDIGAGQTGTLSVWHYDGATWTPFAAPDLTYGDDGIANFAVTGFSGYAVTVAVPEPCSLALVALGGLALIRRRAA